jgi:hypothetical protein
MRRRVGWCLLGVLCATSAACGDPDQLYRHRDGGAQPPSTGGAGSGGVVGPFTGAAGQSGTGAAGATGIVTGAAGALETSGAAGSAGGATGAAGAITGASGANGTAGATGNAGATGASGAAGAGGKGGAAGAIGTAGSTGSAGSTGVDASADGMPACASTPDCHCDYYGGHAYKFCGAGKPYADAATACASQGMRLIRVDDEGENQWAYNGKVSRGFVDMWIGADDRTVAGDWRWSDGTSFWTGKAGAAGAGPVGGLFNAWQTGQPDHANTNEDCAAYNTGNDKWADLPCTNYNAYVCEGY